MGRYSQYLIKCIGCGSNTSKAYARKNAGKCKACVTGIMTERKRGRSSEDGLKWWGGERVRASRCEDAPCCGCCGPQGDGDYYGRDAEDAYRDRYGDR